MTRGNQREKAREKAQKKQKEHEKKKTSGSKDGNRGMTLEERRHRDAEIMRQKQDKKPGEDGAGASSSGGATGGTED
uniref:Small EDRK-rich factor-like N-terminal domain-containing protein n=1 Tax=Arion vulgaris TaxID=1028688 RepID=A0A0B7BBN0_9EUPU